MSEIRVLDHNTVDQIAAGEVVERPASVVKELTENAMDAGADAITVEIRGGGADLIRVTDNGAGIPASQIPNAFLRHATSKIRSIEDLNTLHSMGFRGEALASIASVSRVRMITRQKDELMGHCYEVNGGEASGPEEIGAPEGTTVVVSQLFYNTPVRRKFLKTPTAEGNLIAELMEHLALSRPDISFKFVLNGKNRFMTSGSGDLKEVIHRIFGREAAKSVIPVSREVNGIRIDGYLGSPSMNRPNRNFENCFLNSRYIKSELLSRGIEEGYRGYLMQHKFPFCVLHISMDSAEIDVNVHPSKMDVRFHEREKVFEGLSSSVSETLHSREMIPESPSEKEEEKPAEAPEPFEEKRRQEAASRNFPAEGGAGEDLPESGGITSEGVPGSESAVTEKLRLESRQVGEIAESEKLRSESDTAADPKALSLKTSGGGNRNAEEADEKPAAEDMRRPKERDIFEITFSDEDDTAEVSDLRPAAAGLKAVSAPAVRSQIPPDPYKGAKQLEMLPKERVISEKARKQYRLIGCVFNTYWMFSWQDKLYFVDQHAAHEKVNYERLVAQYNENHVYTQQLAPPIIVTLSPSEKDTMEEYRSVLEKAGFTMEDFGGSEVALTTIPLELYRKEPSALFLETLNELGLKGSGAVSAAVDRVLATMACKAAVKGGDVISMQEMDTVLDELLTLNNPYHCPHGRPTIFSMSRSELERRFKRIV